MKDKEEKERKDIILRYELRVVKEVKKKIKMDERGVLRLGMYEMIEKKWMDWKSDESRDWEDWKGWIGGVRIDKKMRNVERIEEKRKIGRDSKKKGKDEIGKKRIGLGRNMKKMVEEVIVSSLKWRNNWESIMIIDKWKEGDWKDFGIIVDRKKEKEKLNERKDKNNRESDMIEKNMDELINKNGEKEREREKLNSNWIL